jgi:hypothetical protein
MLSTACPPNLRHASPKAQLLHFRKGPDRGNRDWSFFGETCDDEGQTNKVWLYHAKSTPIQRHVKVKGQANPYDPTYESYFEEREGAHMPETFRGTTSKEAFEGLELGEGKPSRPVPRGPGGRQAAWLLGSKRRAKFVFGPRFRPWQDHSLPAWACHTGGPCLGP